jgi:hypothetical protein
MGSSKTKALGNGGKHCGGYFNSGRMFIEHDNLKKQHDAALLHYILAERTLLRTK